MAKLKKIELENGQWVYIQIDENITFNDDWEASEYQETGFEHKGDTNPHEKKVVDKLGNMICAMTDTTNKALKKSSLRSIDKVTLEFGIKLGGEAGIPFITSGKGEGSVKIKVEFSPKDS